MARTQAEWEQLLLSGQLGPWAGQAWVPGGISLLRFNQDGTIGQWEDIVEAPGDATLSFTPSGDPVDISGLEPGPDVTGLLTGVGIQPGAGAGGFGRPQASAVSASNYSIADFVRTELGTIRMTVGISNGVSGPLSPVQMGTNNTEVDKDGNLWLPKVRFGK